MAPIVPPAPGNKGHCQLCETDYPKHKHIVDDRGNPSDLDTEINKGIARTFETGATRDTDAGKLDYEGFLSPLVIKRFAEYMHVCRLQSDGKLRASDNWQKGIPEDVYMKSMWRHFMAVWSDHRRGDHSVLGYEDDLCALMFNVMGMLHEQLKEKL